MDAVHRGPCCCPTFTSHDFTTAVAVLFASFYIKYQVEAVTTLKFVQRYCREHSNFACALQIVFLFLQ